LAEYFTRHGSVLLVDSDPNRTALRWRSRSDRDYAFRVVNINADEDYAAFDFVVLDTPGRPDDATM
jgi:chromosome partitioning protein